MTLEMIQYPIGRFNLPEIITEQIRKEWISTIASFPLKLTNEVNQLSDNELELRYRSGGWTIRQIVHHFADSHMNSFIRFKLALTEEKPVIKPYFEDRWAELSDTKKMQIESSLKLIDAIHQRWAYLLNNLSDEHFARTFVHPEHGKAFRLDEMLGFYAWHGNHHLAHIINAKNNK